MRHVVDVRLNGLTHQHLLPAYTTLDEGQHPMDFVNEGKILSLKLKIEYRNFCSQNIIFFKVFIVFLL